MSQPEPRKPSPSSRPAGIPQARRLEQRPAAVVAPPMIAIPVPDAPVQGVHVNAPAAGIGPPASAGEWSGVPAAPAGSIAQKVRRKTIAEAMWLLLLCGVGNVIWGGVSIVQNENAINASYNRLSFADKANYQSAKDSAVTMTRAVFGTQIVLGVVFVALALTVNRAPLINTALALFLYIAMIAGFAVIEPRSIYVGILGKIFFTLALSGAVATAYRYQRAKKLMAAVAAR